MNRDREFISHLVIVLAACAGAWVMFVQPKANELARLERDLIVATDASEQSSQDSIEQLAAKVASHGQRMREIRRRNAVADETSSLYASIMRLASEHSVKVQALQPIAARDAAGKPQPVRNARLEMVLSGSYESVATFLDSICEIDAFIRPSSLQLMPVDGKQEHLVSARFTCEVLAFTIENALAGVGATDHAQP